MKRLTILRGLPGSGKSTYISKTFPGATPYHMAPAEWSPVIVSADHFFTNFSTGEYNFDSARIGEAHAQAQMKLLLALEDGREHIIVDNTHVQAWDWQVAAKLANLFGYTVDVVDLFDGGLSNEALAARNTHRVPVEIIAGMRLRWWTA